MLQGKRRKEQKDKKGKKPQVNQKGRWKSGVTEERRKTLGAVMKVDLVWYSVTYN